MTSFNLAEMASDALFQAAPVSLWLEDYSNVKRAFDGLRANGTTDLRAHLQAHPQFAGEIASGIGLLTVNERTLSLFGARDLDHLKANLHIVFGDTAHTTFTEELVMMWERNAPQIDFDVVNHTLDGRRLELSLHATALAGHADTWDRVLVTLEDISARKASERYAQGLFEHSPVSLWVEDMSGVRQLIEEARGQGISDFRTFLDVYPDFVDRATESIKVLDVNQQTLRLFHATSKAELIARLGEVFRDDMRASFIEQLCDWWDGKLFHQRETVNYALTGDAVNVYMQISVLPGFETTWERVLVSLTDITARKRAEAYLEYLGKHDSLTKLRNRAFFDEELTRLRRRDSWPIGVVVVDLNGLKPINDNGGHAAGDAILRRAGEALKKAFGDDVCVARTGGDEFGALLPKCDAAHLGQINAHIQSVVDLNNQFYQGPTLSLSVGIAMAHSPMEVDEALRLADARMYEAKHNYYSALGIDRRR